MAKILGLQGEQVDTPADEKKSTKSISVCFGPSNVSTALCWVK